MFLFTVNGKVFLSLPALKRIKKSVPWLASGQKGRISSKRTSAVSLNGGVPYF